jgi:hypothetical protein
VHENFLNEESGPCLIPIDDLINWMYSKEVCHLFTLGSHHRSISVIVITQNLFHQGRYCRDISLNAKYLVLLKNVRAKHQFSHLAKQIYPEDSVSLYEAYLDATRLPHVYLLLDLSQDIDELLRFRTNIFPAQYSPVLYSPVSDETDNVQLSRPKTA